MQRDTIYKSEQVYEPDETFANKSHTVSSQILKRKHNCTDVICLFIFLIIIFIQIALAVYAFVMAPNPIDLLKPIDSEGKRCLNGEKLLYFDLISCAKQIDSLNDVTNLITSGIKHPFYSHLLIHIYVYII
jgi:hypothetical protein